jgi:hypothetical protein
MEIDRKTTPWKCKIDLSEKQEQCTISEAQIQKPKTLKLLTLRNQHNACLNYWEAQMQALSSSYETAYDYILELKTFDYY